MSAPEKDVKLRKKLIAETWRENNELFLAELREEGGTKSDIHEDLSNVLMVMISGLRIAQLNTDNGTSGELDTKIEELGKILVDKGHIRTNYWLQRKGQEVKAGEQRSQLYAELNPHLRLAISDAMALLVKHNMMLPERFHETLETKLTQKARGQDG